MPEKNIKRFIERWHVNPKTLNGDTKKGFNYFFSENYEKAIEYFDKALKKVPKNISLLHVKGFILKHYLKKLREAENCFLNLLKLKPVDEFDWYNRGSTFLFFENDRKALKCFDEALKINSKDICSWDNKAFALIGLGRFKEAIECLNEILKINPENEGAWLGKGEVLSQGHSFEGGKKFRGGRVTEGPKEFVEAWENWRPKYKEAIKCYDKVLEINPKNIYAWREKGLILEDYLDESEVAIKCYDKILKIDPKNIETLSLKASALTAFGGKISTGFPPIEESSRKKWSRIPERFRNNDSMWINLDNERFFDYKRYGEEKFKEAIECYDKILAIDCKITNAWLKKGDIMEILTRYNEAVECYNKVLEIEPKNENEWVTTSVARNHKDIALAKLGAPEGTIKHRGDLKEEVVRDSEMDSFSILTEKDKWDWEIGERLIADLHDWKIRSMRGYQISLDGKNIAAIARLKEGDETIVVNGKIWKKNFFSITNYPVFSPDGKKVAVAVKTKDGRSTIVINEELWEEDLMEIWDEPVFSSDGKKIAITEGDPGCHRGPAIFITEFLNNEFVSNENGWGLYDSGILLGDNPTFSPDSQRIAFTNFDKVEVASPIFEKGVIVVDSGKLWEKSFISHLSRPVFSSDGKKIAVAVAKEKETKIGNKIISEHDGETVIVNNRIWEEIFLSVINLTFSPDSEKVAAVVEIEKQKYTVAIDGKPWKENFHWAWHPVFSPDNEKVAVIVTTKKDRHTIAINGRIWRKGLEKNFDEIYYPLIFSLAGENLLIKARKDLKIYRIILPIEEVLEN